MDRIPNMQNVEQSLNDQSIFQEFQPVPSFQQNYQNFGLNNINPSIYPFNMPQNSTPSIVSSASFDSEESRDTYKHPNSPITSESEHITEKHLYNQQIQPSLISHLYPPYSSRLPAPFFNSQFNGTSLPFNNPPQFDSLYWMQQQLQQQHLMQYQQLHYNNQPEYLVNEKVSNTEIDPHFVDLDYNPHVQQNTEFKNSTPQNSEVGSCESDTDLKNTSNKSSWYEMRKARLNNQKSSLFFDNA